MRIKIGVDADLQIRLIQTQIGVDADLPACACLRRQADRQIRLMRIKIGLDAELQIPPSSYSTGQACECK